MGPGHLSPCEESSSGDRRCWVPVLLCPPETLGPGLSEPQLPVCTRDFRNELPSLFVFLCPNTGMRLGFKSVCPSPEKLRAPVVQAGPVHGLGNRRGASPCLRPPPPLVFYLWLSNPDSPPSTLHGDRPSFCLEGNLSNGLFRRAVCPGRAVPGDCRTV